MKVEVLTVDRGLVDLEVTRVDDDADRRGDGEGHAIRHAVRDSNEFDRQRADRDRVARADRLEAVGHVELVLLEFRFEERQCHGGAVHRPIEEGHQVGHGADMVFMAVGEDERLDLFPSTFDERHVGNDQIDAELVGVREHDAGVDEDRRLPPRHRHHVHTELAEASQWDDLERARRHGRYGNLIHSDSSWERLRCN